jgi:hypothetical protein
MSDQTITVNRFFDQQAPNQAADPMSGEQGDLNDSLLATDIWTDQHVASSGIPVFDVPMVSIGGGMGSFALYHLLRVAGLSPDSIKVVSDIEVPYATYQYLCTLSQIPQFERIRSDSGSVMDNIWGFPGYAYREFADKEFRAKAGQKGITKALAPVWNVFAEPIGLDYYTPMSGQVFKSIDREVVRLDWHQVLVKGTARVIRRRQGGGYFVVFTPPVGSYPTKRVAYRCRFVHVSVGYPGLRYLPDLQKFRDTYRDFSVVNAYEDHEHVYQHLIRHGGSVIVRGSGIVSSRVLQRLMDDRQKHGAQTQIWHLFRNYVGGSHGPDRFNRRRGGDGFAYQGFNYSKSGWGGQLYTLMQNEDPKARADLIKLHGGTNTPKRKYWQNQIKEGLSAGWYKQFQGQVSEVVPGPNGGTITKITASDGSKLELNATFIIDATGLEANPREHRLLGDILDHCGAGTNAMGRFDVAPTFEIRGTRSEPGRMYTMGASTLGGYLAPVDSFLGLQMAAIQIADDLAAQGFVPRIGPGRSIKGWLNWARNKKP